MPVAPIGRSASSASTTCARTRPSSPRPRAGARRHGWPPSRTRGASWPRHGRRRGADRGRPRGADRCRLRRAPVGAAAGRQPAALITTGATPRPMRRTPRGQRDRPYPACRRRSPSASWASCAPSARPTTCAPACALSRRGRRVAVRRPGGQDRLRGDAAGGDGGVGVAYAVRTGAGPQAASRGRIRWGRWRWIRSSTGTAGAIGDLRVSVTDRCNFRCQYCMPAEGLPWLERDDVLHFEEIERLVALLAAMGVTRRAPDRRRAARAPRLPDARRRCSPPLRRGPQRHDQRLPARARRRGARRAPASRASTSRSTRCSATASSR